MLRTVKSVSISLAVAAVLILGADFVLTKLGMGPEYFKIEGIRNGRTATIVTHPIYHHDLMPDVDGWFDWGNGPTRMCTNRFGFRISCADRDETPRKIYDLAFIGDSFTEGVGSSYEDSFVGRYAQKHPEISVANLGVSTYSPTICYRKVRFLLDDGFTFKHVVVLPDISDITDEAAAYMLDPRTGNVVAKVNQPERKDKTVGDARKMVYRIRDTLNESFRLTNFLVKRLRKYFFPKKDTPGIDIVYPRSAWTYDPEADGHGTAGVAGGIAQALESMGKLKRLLDEHNIPMTVVVYPWPDQLAHDKPDHLGMTLWRDFCAREHCVGFIDANRLFFEQVGQLGLRPAVQRYYIQGDVHFNAEGNKLVFDAIDAGLAP
ncbi:MAG: hypothetical protein LBC14_08370 [Desulfovibrio sp.]|jgi:hypothetical protein|nr:hypothetical protein [Desulfovibrio sp.]